MSKRSNSKFTDGEFKIHSPSECKLLMDLIQNPSIEQLSPEKFYSDIAIQKAESLKTDSFLLQCFEAMVKKESRYLKMQGDIIELRTKIEMYEKETEELEEETEQINRQINLISGMRNNFFSL